VTVWMHKETGELAIVSNYVLKLGSIRVARVERETDSYYASLDAIAEDYEYIGEF
jgi:hypothetical protein